MARPRKPSSSGMRGRRSRSDATDATAALDTIGNGALHALEEDEAAEKDDEDGGGRDEKTRRGGVAMAGESPAKAVNDACHGIEAIEPAPTLRNERTGIGDRRSEHP